MAKIIGLNDNVKTAAPKKKISIDQSTEVVCEKCGHNVFIPGAMFRKISKILTGTPNDALIPIEVYLCGECGTINNELLPPEIRVESKK